MIVILDCHLQHKICDIDYHKANSYDDHGHAVNCPSLLKCCDNLNVMILRNL